MFAIILLLTGMSAYAPPTIHAAAPDAMPSHKGGAAVADFYVLKSKGTVSIILVKITNDH